MTHQKKQAVPKNWPIKRKGMTFVVRPIGGEVPLLILLRDFLEIVQNRKEAKKAINQENVLVNNRKVKDERIGLNLMDTLSIIPSKKYYRLIVGENKKLGLEEISEKDSKKKVSKVKDKKILRGKKRQLNLYDGKNFFSDIECKVNDSVLINLDEKKIEKCLELKEKANVMVFAGKHAGKRGTIKKVDAERKMATIKTKDEEINVLIKQIMVTE